jgi:hypothetical protein
MKTVRIRNICKFAEYFKVDNKNGVLRDDRKGLLTIVHFSVKTSQNLFLWTKQMLKTEEIDSPMLKTL